MLLENRYEGLFNHLADEVHLWEIVRNSDHSIRTWRLVDVNPSALAGWGREKSDVIGQTADEIFGPEAMEQFMPVVQRIYATGKPHEWIEYFPSTEQYLQMTSIPLGEYFISTGKDITEDRTARKQLEESQRLLEYTEDIAKQGSWKFDIVNSEWSFSKNWVRLFGIDKKYDTSDLSAAVDPSDLPRVSAEFNDAIRGKSNYQIEHRIVTRAGERKWVSVSAEVQRDENGTPIALIGITRDITEEKNAKKALEESEDFLNRTGALAKVGGWYLDGNFDRPNWTKATYDIHEVPYDYIPTIEEAVDFYHPDDRDAVAAAVNEAIEKGESFEFEARIITAKGNLKWIYSRGESEVLNGKTVRVSGVFQDITDQKRKASRLEMLTKAIDYSQSGFDIVNHEGEFVYVNYAHSAMFGYDSPNELIGKSPRDLCVDPDFPSKLVKILREKGEYTGELRAKRKDGTEFTLLMLSRLDFDEDGNEIYPTSSIDITEQREVEEELQKVATELRRVVNSVPGTIYQFVFNQDGTFTIPFMSDKATELLGLTKEQMMNPDYLFSRLHPEDYDKTMTSILEVNKENSSWTREFRAFDREGNIRWIAGHAYGSLNVDGNVVHHGVLFDITEEKEAELALKTSRQEYRNVADNLPGIVLKYKLNPDGSDEILYISKGVEGLFEVSAEKALKNVDLIWNRIHKDDVEQMIPSIEKSARELSIWEFEYRIVFPDGRIKWLWLKGIPEKKKDESVVWDTIGLDITKRKEVERQLEQMNANLEKLVEERAEKAIQLSVELEKYWLAAEHSKSGVWRYNVLTNALEWDSIMYELFGIEPEEFSGAYEAWESSLHPDDIEENVQALQHTIASGQDLDILFRIIHRRSQEVRYIRGMGKVEKNLEGKTIAVFGTNWDVTDEVLLAQEKEEIIKELKIYQRSAGNAEVGVWEFDVSTQSTKWDDTLFRIYEFEKAKYPNQIVPIDDFMKVVIPEDIEPLNRDLEITLQTGKPLDVMFRIQVGESGTTKYIRSKGQVQRNEEGEIVSMYGTNWDVTKEMKLVDERERALNQLKNAQSQLIQSEKMASLGILTAGVAHELNNPLNYIMGGYYAIQQELEDHAAIELQDLREYLSWVKEGAERATTIVKGLNIFSRNTEEEIEEFDVHQVIEDCLLMLRNKYKDRILIRKKYASDQARIKGNSGKLHQAMLNILSNAIDAIEKEGEVVIETKSNPKEWIVVVSDNGRGIEDSKIEKVMDPFFTTKPPGKGTGLGLSITNSIIQEHNGRLDITSKQNKGTSVKMSFPKRKDTRS